MHSASKARCLTLEVALVLELLERVLKNRIREDQREVMAGIEDCTAHPLARAGPSKRQRTYEVFLRAADRGPAHALCRQRGSIGDHPSSSVTGTPRAFASLVRTSKPGFALVPASRAEM